MKSVACGIDWAEDHHDIAIVDESGLVVAAERVGNNLIGLRRVLELLCEHDQVDESIPVAIETSSGLLVAGLRAAGRTVFAINPLAVSRYRDRYRSSGGKSDSFDAMVLANVLRTDRAAHRQLPADTPGLLALRVLTRAQQDAVWERTELTNRIRTLLKEFFPAALAAFERGGRHQLHSAACRIVLRAAPTPDAARKLSKAKLEAGLRRAGRSRGITAEVDVLLSHLRTEHIRQDRIVEEAMGLKLRGLIGQLDGVCIALEELETAVERAFSAHSDAQVMLSFPGLGTQLAARMLAEIGDDRERFADARALKAFAGAAPVTRASGKSNFVHARRAKNDRIAAAGYVWALAAIRHDPRWQDRYRNRREAGDHHAAALRRLFNLMLGKLHHCLINHQPYEPDLAFADRHHPVLA